MTADRTAALEAAQSGAFNDLERDKLIDIAEASNIEIPRLRAALASTAKEADRMREALEITRVQLNVSAAGKIALSREKHLSIVEAALLPSEGKPQS